MNALKNLAKVCQAKGITMVFSHVNEQPMRAMEKAGFVDRVGRENFRPNIEAALEWANQCANNIEEDKTGIKDKSYI